MRTDDSFSSFKALVDCYRGLIGVESPVLPRRRKAPQRYEIGPVQALIANQSTNFTAASIMKYWTLPFVFSINDRFDQPGYKMYTNLESLLVEAANRHDFDEYLEKVTAFYKDNFNRSLLSTQLQIEELVSFQECLKTIQSLSDGQKSFFSQVCRLDFGNASHQCCQRTYVFCHEMHQDIPEKFNAWRLIEPPHDSRCPQRWNR